MDSNDNNNMDEPISWLEWFLMRESTPKNNSEVKQALF